MPNKIHYNPGSSDSQAREESLPTGTPPRSASPARGLGELSSSRTGTGAISALRGSPIEASEPGKAPSPHGAGASPVLGRKRELAGDTPSSNTGCLWPPTVADENPPSAKLAESRAKRGTGLDAVEGLRTPTSELEGEAAPRIVGARVDALVVAWQARPRLPLCQALEALERAHGPVDHPLAVGGYALAWRKRGQLWVGRNADLALRIDPSASMGWCLAAEARAVLLATAGPEVALARMRELLAGASGGSWLEGAPPRQIHDGERLRRLDLAADAEGVTFSDTDRNHWVGRFRKAVRYHRGRPEARAYGRRRDGAWQPTGMAVGFGSPLSIRLYDKTEELSALHAETEKQATEEAGWRARGWQGGQVWRLEAQLRGDVLDELQLRDPDKALAKVDAVWRYLVGAPGEREAWLRLVDPTRTTRTRRAPVDVRWMTFQSAVFRARANAPCVRIRKPRGGAEPMTALGTVLSTLGARGLLELGMPLETTAKASLEQDLQRFCRVVLDEVAKGDEWAYHAKRQAVAARFASSEPAERVGLADSFLRLGGPFGIEVLDAEAIAMRESNPEARTHRMARDCPDWATWARDADAMSQDALTRCQETPLGRDAVCLHAAVGAADWSIWEDAGRFTARRPGVAVQLRRERQYRHVIVTCPRAHRSLACDVWWPGARWYDGAADVSLTHGKDAVFVDDARRRLELLEDKQCQL